MSQTVFRLKGRGPTNFGQNVFHPASYAYDGPVIDLTSYITRIYMFSAAKNVSSGAQPTDPKSRIRRPIDGPETRNPGPYTPFLPSSKSLYFPIISVLSTTIYETKPLFRIFLFQQTPWATQLIFVSDMGILEMTATLG